MPLLNAADAMLNRRLNQAAGVAITYTRGAECITIAADGGAWVGRTRFASNLDGGARIEWGDRDYLLTVAALTSLGEPQEGDRITETISGTEMTFEVMRPDTGEPSWRYSDATRTRYRLHVKRVT